MTFDVIIPTYKPGKEFERLLRGILKQEKKPDNIFVINTEQAFWNKKFESVMDFTLLHIKKEEFDHGGTRKMAADMVKSDFFVCMTQDAVPKNEKLFSNLLQPFSDKNVAVVYARQEVDEKASAIEAFTREFNYPKQKRVKKKGDEKTLGIKAWFSSDVCAMYRKKAYDEAGGFVLKTIFNEDMLMAYEAMERGYQVVYEPAAAVVHYHEYTLGQQFHRNFDLGVSHREFRHIFGKVSSEKEGGALVKKTALYLLQNKKWYLVPKLFFHSAAKYLGYLLGKRYDKLPKRLVLKLCMNKGYFQ